MSYGPGDGGLEYLSESAVNPVVCRDPATGVAWLETGRGPIRVGQEDVDRVTRG